MLADIRFLKGTDPILKEVCHFAAHRGLKDVGEVQKMATAIHTALVHALDTGGPFDTKTAIKDAALAKAFVASLINCGILPKHRLASPRAVSLPITLAAVCAMHGTDVKLANGDVARLGLRVGANGTLEVGAYLPITRPKAVTVNVAVFVTSVPITSVCEGRLLVELQNPSRVVDSETTVERSPAMMLRFLE